MAAGCGIGSPSERDPDLVADDLANGFISKEAISTESCCAPTCRLMSRERPSCEAGLIGTSPSARFGGAFYDSPRHPGRRIAHQDPLPPVFAGKRGCWDFGCVAPSSR
jgi:hypothetical protein